MAHQLMVFQGFGRGEYGLAPSWEVGYRLLRQRLIYAGAFTGTNVMRYIGGQLGPRNEFQTYSTSGAPGSPSVKAIGLNYENGVGLFWALVDAASALTVYQATPLGSPLALVSCGTMTYLGGTQQGNYQALLLGDVTWIVSSLDKLYKLDHATHTLTAVAGSPRGRSICQYGDRTIIAGPDALGTTPDPNQNRLYYSAPQNPADWSGTWSGGPGAGLNYIDVGNASSPITGVHTLRDTLVITKGGADQEWWVLTGVPGVNDSLRRVFISTAPSWQHSAASIAGGDMIAFTEDNLIGDSSVSVPGEFNGIATTTHRELAIPASGGIILRLQRGDDRILWTASRFLMHRDGAWTKHDTSNLSLTSLVAVDPIANRICSVNANLTAVYILQPYADAASATVSYTPDKVRFLPAISGSVGYGALPAAMCQFDLPEYALFGDGEVACRGVYVDFTTYSGLPAGNNTFNVNLTSRRTLTGGAAVAPTEPAVQTGSFSQPQPTASRRDRRFFGFKPLFGNSWQVGFDTIRGVAVEKVTVVFDERQGQAA